MEFFSKKVDIFCLFCYNSCSLVIHIVATHLWQGNTVSKGVIYMSYCENLQKGDILEINGTSGLNQIAVVIDVSSYGITAEPQILRALGNTVPFNGGTFGNQIDPSVMLSEGTKIHLSFNSPGKTFQKQKLPLNLKSQAQYPALSKIDFDTICKIEGNRNLMGLYRR